MLSLRGAQYMPSVVKSPPKVLIPLRLSVFENNIGQPAVRVFDESSQILCYRPLSELNELRWGHE